jgi:hypothetical protein
VLVVQETVEKGAPSSWTVAVYSKWPNPIPVTVTRLSPDDGKFGQIRDMTGASKLNATLDVPTTDSTVPWIYPG